MSDIEKLPTNPLYRSLFFRTLSHSSSLGGDAGECFQALRDAGKIRPASWLTAWSELGSRLNRHARTLLEMQPPQKYSAKMAYLRASNYHRTAFAHMWASPMDENAIIPSYKAMRANFAAAAKLFDPPLIPLKIPFQGAILRGYLANPPDTYRNGRLMVVIGGYDSPMEELYLFSGYHAVSRGYSVVVFDGPGQGGTLIESGLKMSHNYDEVLACVLDVAAQHGTWKETILMGLSLGGLLCLQAVTGVRVVGRVQALVADPAEINLLDAFRSQLPFPRTLRDQLPEGPVWARWFLSIVLSRMAGDQGIAGWKLRRGMIVHGCQTPMEYVKSLHEFDNAPILDRIKIPTLVTMAENSETGNQADAAFKKLVNCDKKSSMLFKNVEGAAGNCQTGARMFYNEKMFSWLDKTLY